MQNIDDYIIENGTSGIWTYEKWNSGKAICYSKQNVTAAVTAAWGSVFESSTSYNYNYPTNFFIGNAPLFIASNSNTAAWLEISYNESITRTPSIFIVRPYSTAASATYSINMLAIGRWK